MERLRRDVGKSDAAAPGIRNPSTGFPRSLTGVSAGLESYPQVFHTVKNGDNGPFADHCQALLAAYLRVTDQRPLRPSCAVISETWL